MMRSLRDLTLRGLVRLPRPVLRKITGGPHVRDGQTLDEQVAVILNGIKLLGLRESEDVEISRKGMDDDVLSVAPPLRKMARERDLSLDVGHARLDARLYVPEGTTRPPLLVYFHGGGFVQGSIASHDPAVRELADLARVAVLSVAYRLAPEHRAPAAGEDAFGALMWARENAVVLGIDPDRIGVGGDSAGGNLSALVTHRCRAKGEAQPKAQILIYPAVDFTRAMPSHRLFASGYILEAKRIDWFIDHYLPPGADKRDPLLSPLFEGRFDGLAPAVVVTAGFDPLRDEGRAYADKLEAGGTKTVYRCEPSLLHGFFNLSGVVDASKEANRWIAARTSELLRA